jgi:urate oxidase
MSLLAENAYGKSRVRLVKVKRRGDWHDFREWTLEILLEGDFESCFTAGDNSKILPTDTMKNTVYAMAGNSSAEGIEEFAQELLEFFLERNSQVSAGRIKVWEKAWEHLSTGGKPHPSTFVQASGERQTTEVAAKNGGVATVHSGLEHLVILKTSGSEFAGYIKDPLTTLPESHDRLLGTSLSARWKYSSPGAAFGVLRSSIRKTLLDVFAEHYSKSVQHTLYAMGEAVLGAVPEVEDIELEMPNIHCLLVDLSRFGQENHNEIFVPIDEPHGTIKARLRRQR